MDEGLLRISPVGCGQLLKLLITLEPHDIFGLHFADVVRMCGPTPLHTCTYMLNIAKICLN